MTSVILYGKAKGSTYDPEAVPTWLEIWHLVRWKETAKGERRRQLEKEIEEKEERRSVAIRCTGDYAPGADRGTRCYRCPGCKEHCRSGPGKEGNGWFHAASIRTYRLLPSCSACSKRAHLYDGICSDCPRPPHCVQEWCPCKDCGEARAKFREHNAKTPCTCHGCDQVRMFNFHSKPANSWGPAGITCDWCYRHADGPIDRLNHRCP